MTHMRKYWFFAAMFAVGVGALAYGILGFGQQEALMAVGLMLIVAAAAFSSVGGTSDAQASQVTELTKDVAIHKLKEEVCTARNARDHLAWKLKETEQQLPKPVSTGVVHGAPTKENYK